MVRLGTFEQERNDKKWGGIHRLVPSAHVARGQAETVIQSVSLRDNGQWSMIHVLRSRYMTEMEN